MTTKTALKRGQKVTIYEDPYTCLKPEGEAKLIRKEFDMPPDCEYWQVEFPGHRTDYGAWMYAQRVGRIIKVAP